MKPKCIPSQGLERSCSSRLLWRVPFPGICEYSLRDAWTLQGDEDSPGYKITKVLLPARAILREVSASLSSTRSAKDRCLDVSGQSSSG